MTIDKNKLEFVGKLTASVSHEIKNVFASIKELSGLMEDLIEFSDESSFSHKDKIISANEKINKQVQRGNEIVKNFNSFAHMFNDNKTDVNLNNLLDVIVNISKRFASNKNIQLELKSTSEDFKFETEPLTLMQIVFHSMNLFIEKLNANEKITITLDKIEENYRICIHSSYILDNSEEEFIANTNGNIHVTDPNISIKYLDNNRVEIDLNKN